MAAVREQKVMAVRGMTCNNCVRHVTRALQGVKGVTSVNVDLASGKATVEYEPATASLDAMAHALKDAGYTLETKS